MSKIEEMADRLTKGNSVTILGIKHLNKTDIIEIFKIAKGGN